MRLHRFAKGTEHRCINAIGLGQDADRASKLSHPTGLYHARFYTATLQSLHDTSFVSSAGFPNHLHLPSDCFKQTEELFCSGHIIRQTMELFFPRHIQMRFSHINSNIDNFLLHGFNYSCL